MVIKMKGKITALLLSAGILLCTGISVAYYNTRTFGFDEDAKIVSYDDEKITILDFDIYFSELNEFVEKAKTLTPDTHYTV